MADYNSNYTGQEIDEAVGKALSAGGVFTVIATFSKSRTETAGYGEYYDCDKPGQDIVDAYLSGAILKVLLFTEWGQSDGGYAPLDRPTLCKGFTFITNYEAGSADTLVLVDEYSNQSFLYCTYDPTGAYIESNSSYLPYVDSGGGGEGGDG